MTHVFERTFLTCPYARARDYLRGALEPAAQDRLTHVFPLSGPLPGATIGKNVLVRYERGRDPMHFDEPWRVLWTPEESGPYPDFAGELIVRADEAHPGAVLELHGDYAPPLGAVGRAFDMVLGAKIASATARALLAQIRAQLDARYEEEELRVQRARII
jgi:hypothetical protein